jgi:hypothetical protein
MNLAQAVIQWDDDHAAAASIGAPPEHLRPFGKLLDGLRVTAPLRFHPYQNDIHDNYLEKLNRWLDCFEPEDRPLAFFLASKVVFVTLKQFEALQRRLFEHHIRRLMLDSAIARRSLSPFDYKAAELYLTEEMDTTLFVANSDSSPLNAFTHVNSARFTDRASRRLVGPDIRFWVYPAERRGDPLSTDQQAALDDYENKVLATDGRLWGKTRLVVLEDFSGTGSDMLTTLNLIHESPFPVHEVCLALVMCTQHAFGLLMDRCAKLNALGSRTYSVHAALILPESFRCFDGPDKSYLADSPAFPDAPQQLKALADKVYAQHFTGKLPAEATYGFGKLALAFVFYSNCPDNTLPLLWSEIGSWYPLFRRASRII